MHPSRPEPPPGSGADALEASPDAAEASLLREGERLRPWHLNVEITGRLGTRDFLEPVAASTPGAFYDPGPGFRWLMKRLFPTGLQGRSVLDCACNCGAYLFLAREMGAGECLGFDVREHWIEQARFLSRARSAPSDGIRFEVCDLYDVPALELERFDVVLFRGILYHLPDPIEGLRIAADLTGELMILSTASRRGFPDGALVAGEESRTRLLSGVHGLQWYPTGPAVLARMLEWAGLSAIRHGPWYKAPGSGAGIDNIGIYAAREEAVFEDFDSQRPGGHLGRIREVVRTLTPPESTVLVASGGDDRVLEQITGLDGRTALHFPPADAVDESSALDELYRRGAGYILFSPATFRWLEEREAFRHQLQGRSSVVVDEDACRLLALRRE